MGSGAGIAGQGCWGTAQMKGSLPACFRGCFRSDKPPRQLGRCPPSSPVPLPPRHTPRWRSHTATLTRCTRSVCRVEAEVQRMFASELKELLSVPELLEDVQLVDVREQGEYDLAHLPAFKLLPLSQAQEWSQNIEAYLEPSKRTVVLCHHGMRSMQMCSVRGGAGCMHGTVREGRDGWCGGAVRWAEGCSLCVEGWGDWVWDRRAFWALKAHCGAVPPACPHCAACPW